jgi:hypothetical protein
MSRQSAEAQAIESRVAEQRESGAHDLVSPALRVPFVPVARHRVDNLMISAQYSVGDFNTVKVFSKDGRSRGGWQPTDNLSIVDR